MIKYKLLKQNLTTHGGFQWEVGKTYTIEKPGNNMCSDEVFHCYESPSTAVIFNHRHANIKNPVCYSVEVGKIVASDAMKMGTKSMALIEQVNLPVFTNRQYRVFAILCAKRAIDKTNLNIPEWNKWADLCLSGKASAADASYAAAAAAADAYYAADDAATNAAAASYAAADAAAAASYASYAAAANAATNDADAAAAVYAEFADRALKEY